MPEPPAVDAPSSGLAVPGLSARLHDLVAGLCVAGLLLPEAVAYAGLARLPVMHALTAMLVGLAAYAVFGGSRFAIVAPTSSTATLAAAAALSISSGAAAVSPAAYVQALLGLTLLAGVALMLLAIARQGQLSAFGSRQSILATFLTSGTFIRCLHSGQRTFFPCWANGTTHLAANTLQFSGS